MDDLTWVLMNDGIIEFIKRVEEIDIRRGLPNILQLSYNEFNKSNYTEARMLDSIYHMKSKLPLKSHIWHENVNSVSLCTQPCYGHHFITLLDYVNH